MSGEITEIMPENFNPEEEKETLEDKEILDAVESGDDATLDKYIKKIVENELKSTVLSKNKK